MILESPSKQRLPLIYLVLFCIIVGVISALWGYRYYAENSVDFIPQIIRVNHPDYLPNDFYLNVTSGPTSPRFFFNKLMAGLTVLQPLSRISLELTVLCSILLALLTALFTRDLYNGSHIAALFSALTVMSANAFFLGTENNLYNKSFGPNQLIWPLLLVGIWAALRQRPLLTGLAAGLATLLHPLVGPEVGLLLLFTLVVEQVAHKFRPIIFPRCTNLFAILTSGVILTAFTAVVLVPIFGAPHISDSQFIQIYAYFRNPHHIIPSSWPFIERVEAVVYLVAVGILWRLCYSISARLREFTPALVIICTTVFGLCLGGYVFVELIPTRLWASAQTFRFLIVLKWIGLTLTGGWIGYKIEQTIQSTVSKRDFLLSGMNIVILLTSLLSPWNLLVVSIFNYLRERYKAAWLGGILPSLVILGSSLSIAKIYKPELRVAFLVPFFAVLALLLSYARPRRLGAVVISILGAALLAPNLWPAAFPQVGNHFIMVPPSSTMEIVDEDMVALGYFAREHTPPDAVFLVDPKMSLFRLAADRALVVDFKNFPQLDQAMLDWQQRLFDCYGVPKRMGFGALSEMSKNYEKITDSQLDRLQIKYGFSYAILHHKTKTQYPIIYETDKYKIIQVK